MMARRFPLPSYLFGMGLIICVPASRTQQAAPAEKKVVENPAKPAGAPAAASRGAMLYGERCGICHYAESEAQKMGPGLKGIYHRGKYDSGGKVDDASMEKWISNGGKDMPPFKAVLSPSQIRDLIAYLKTI